jgi:hypothetical protein
MPLTIAQDPRALPSVLLPALVFVLLATASGAALAQPASPGGAPVPVDDPFGRRGWHLEVSTDLALETWNYNGNREEMYGLVTGITYGVRDGVVLTASGPLYYVSQRGVDAFLLGATFGVRGRVWRRGPSAAFLEFQVGISQADTPTPPRGTRFNYLALGGAGVAIRIQRHAHLLAGLKWVHVSNASLAGRDRNPDIEAVGPRIGILVGF